ncbi:MULTISPECIES: NAD(P)/FAD-dependent oxidoreductase [Leptospira]|uniref:NADH:ubiquinone reductase (non-electrogenic) n=1 Tax=Leptospira borgpetersenii serovar Javanica str. UI 09931 TaxID=1049767 RepID=A0AAV3J943_LEPBO|nr:MULTISPECIES: NAD(P)/FAD-dependent oxidoreductase [Leptospira]AXX17592.1 NAD(P)/FAD-dependent oxidoreductase [Leptospira borgpetersenii serovar Ceylonica]EKQ91490.1 pyridine nucleotide-disulfide oxidoreductase [Leptospira borgpetersenii str. UI 09149]EMK13565.1 pyridine nucleotide-disulfide oxidoreductase [Leptospira sp. serovar Kenya str. Sh9]EMN58655.1 pyridine nucleotide-disulfide oxidoreductase [Leptospira borgpetersenii serovar Javanica str. MK146]EPG56159.1 pyridine nucleotide-disulfi
MSETRKRKIVVVGAGFGGLQVIKKLSQNNNLDITVIDKKNHHLFQPLLYQVATAVLSPADIAIPIRSLVGERLNVTVVLGEATKVDLATKTVYYQNTSTNYDYLILSAGAKSSYFGNDHWEKYTIGLKNLKDALRIRHKLLISFEKAELSGDPEVVKALLNYVIIGGGPTGVELAGSIAELSHQIIRDEFHTIDPALSKITLIEAAPRLLTTFDPSLGEFTKKRLESRGVEVLTGTRVIDINERGVQLEEKMITTQTVIWAAGVQANTIASTLGVTLDRGGRVIVDEFCNIEGHPEVFVIGDIANYSKGLEHPLPGVSPVAMQQGRYVAALIQGDLKNKKRKSFRYVDKGSMATIGRTDAVAQMGVLRMRGLFGWFAWLFVHLFYQVGFKNKVTILITWVWSYIAFRAEARVIQDEISADNG